MKARTVYAAIFVAAGLVVVACAAKKPPPREPPHVETLLRVTAPQVAGKLKQERVDAVLLTPA